MNILVTVHNNGIVNQCQIINNNEINYDKDENITRDCVSSNKRLNINNKTQTQIIWNGYLKFIDVGLNSTPSQVNSNIKSYRAVYLNGVMIVKDGQVYPKLSLRAKILNWWNKKKHY